uniref:Uncharacterized protein n=1 Tax=Opuntia streptacantha TaxID=393608 RepID=A0A7C9A3T8_OPUST
MLKGLQSKKQIPNEPKNRTCSYAEKKNPLFPMTLWILPNRITILITLLTVIIIVIILGIVIFIRRWRGIKTCSIHGPPYNLLNLILIFKINVIDDTQTISRKFTNVPRSIARGIDICR